jgi:hypothetical protein
MARIALIEPEQATPEVKEIYEQKLKGKPGNVQKALAHRPEMLKISSDSTPAWAGRLIASSTN